ncbi:unnamed protein product [Bubo scandiacus]
MAKLKVHIPYSLKAESRANHIAGLNATVSTEVEFGVCTVTCGKIGLQEVLLTSGCPGTEAKCIVHVEECQGPVECGWGIPISEGLACVKMPCIYIPPENRFKYVWKMFIPNKTAHILPDDSAIMKVCRDTHSVTFQCGTQENGNIIASVKCRVYAKTGKLIETLTVFYHKTPKAFFFPSPTIQSRHSFLYRGSFLFET